MSAGVVVVGAGECGVRAALTLRSRGFDGPVTLVGAEPPYERPPLSKTWTTRPIGESDTLAGRGVTVRQTSVTALDAAAHRVTLADGTGLAYSSLLLATGARARPLPLDGAPVHVLRTRSDAGALRARLGPGVRVGIVGAGFVGLELAASAVALGCAVTVLELGPRALGRAVPAVVADVVARRHRDAGVDLRFGTRVSGLDPTPGGTRIGTDRGPVDVDVVVAGVGAAPETALAGAAGLDVADGIVVDGRFRTSAPDVFAAGDCCAHPHPLAGERIRLESWRVAREHGEAAAAAILGADAPYAGVPWFWSDQYDLSLQVAGLPGRATREVVRARPDGVALWFGLRDGRLVAAAGGGPGNAVAKDVRLAEMLIARGATPAADALADPAVALKSLLRTPVAA